MRGRCQLLTLDICKLLRLNVHKTQMHHPVTLSWHWANQSCIHPLNTERFNEETARTYVIAPYFNVYVHVYLVGVFVCNIVVFQAAMCHLCLSLCVVCVLSAYIAWCCLSASSFPCAYLICPSPAPWLFKLSHFKHNMQIPKDSETTWTEAVI